MPAFLRVQRTGWLQATFRFRSLSVDPWIRRVTSQWTAKQRRHQDSTFLFWAGEGFPGSGEGRPGACTQPRPLLASPRPGAPRCGPLWGLVRLQGRVMWGGLLPTGAKDSDEADASRFEGCPRADLGSHLLVAPACRWVSALSPAPPRKAEDGLQSSLRSKCLPAVAFAN